MSEAFKAAKREGLSFFWASLHVGGSTQFVGQCWADGGYRTNADGDPISDSNGNTVATFTVEPLDKNNRQHVAQVAEWYGE